MCDAKPARDGDSEAEVNPGFYRVTVNDVKRFDCVRASCHRSVIAPLTIRFRFKSMVFRVYVKPFAHTHTYFSFLLSIKEGGRA